MNNLYNWVNLIYVALGALGTLICTFMTYYRKMKQIEKTMKVSTGDRIVSLYSKCKEKQCVERYELNNFRSLYSEYKSLNGNSFIDGVAKEFLSLPTK